MHASSVPFTKTTGTLQYELLNVEVNFIKPYIDGMSMMILRQER